MRLKQTRVKTYTMRPRIIEIDAEGVPNSRYGDSFTVRGELWDAGGNRQVNEYGNSVKNTANMRIEGEYKICLDKGTPYVLFADSREIRLNDGIYVYADSEADTPDYTVVGFVEYQPLKLEVEANGEYQKIPQGHSES